jgi:hypothetical protein
VIGDTRYLKERDSMILHEGERPLTTGTPVTGSKTIQFPRGTPVEIMTAETTDGYLIVRAVNTEFYQWTRTVHLMHR